LTFLDHSHLNESSR